LIGASRKFFGFLQIHNVLSLKQAVKAKPSISVALMQQAREIEDVSFSVLNKRAWTNQECGPFIKYTRFYSLLPYLPVFVFPMRPLVGSVLRKTGYTNHNLIPWFSPGSALTSTHEGNAPVSRAFCNSASGTGAFSFLRRAIMWVRTMDGKLVNLAIAACIEWYHLGPDRQQREDIYELRAQVGHEDLAFYSLARNLTQEEAESLLNLIAEKIGVQDYLDLRSYKVRQTDMTSGGVGKETQNR
jgi:hypothetical protein